MRSFLRAARTSFLFIGSIVGAGFATGREIAQFFGGGSVWNLWIAAAFTGVSSFFFLETGAKGAYIDPRVKTGADTAIALSSFVVYAAMIASAESVLRSAFGVNGLSLLLAAFCALFSAKSVKPVARLNLIAVPIMIAIVIAVGAKTPFAAWSGKIRPVYSMAYGAMNMLFSGALMIEEGKGLSKKERIAASVLSGILLFAALFFMFRSIGGAPYPEMPFLRAAENAGLGSIASVVLLLAILTTMAGCDYLVAGKLTSVTGDPVLSGALVLLFGVLLSSVGFAPIVRVAYPVVSYLGLAFTILAPVYVRCLQYKSVKC